MRNLLRTVFAVCLVVGSCGVLWAEETFDEAATRALSQYERQQGIVSQPIVNERSIPAEQPVASVQSYSDWSQSKDTEEVKQAYVARNEGYFVQPQQATLPRKVLEGNFGFETYHYKYKETVGGEHFMDNKGQFNGVYAALTYHPQADLGLYSDVIDFYRVDARIAWASLNYNGGVQDNMGNSYPLMLNNVPDTVYELRGVAGKDLFWHGTRFSPYGGLGYRHLNDNSSDNWGIVNVAGTDYVVTGGYRRISQYLYLPLGMDVKKALRDSWQVGGNAEYDYLFYGKQESFVESTAGGVPTNKQNHGYGLRASLRVEKDTPRVGYVLEPFIRYWNIEDSEWTPIEACASGVSCQGIIEPSNETTEIGLKLGVQF